jgi:hypothetical protein
VTRFGLTHSSEGYIDVRFGDDPLFRYVYLPGTPPVESPRPYFHPLYTLAGHVVTGFRPPDHRWHHGLSMTVAYLSGENFWGGKTYVRNQGYVQLNNNGQQQHIGWESLVSDPDHVALDERLTWLAHAGDRWIDERRHIEVSQVGVVQGFWCLDVRLQLRNIRGQSLVFGSPTTQGRPKAGYGGFFWRGAQDFPGGTILVDGGLEAAGHEESILGKSGRWLAYVSPHQDTNRASTVILVDQPGNPRYPNQWFVRANQVAYASFAFMFDKTLTLEPDEELALSYRVILVRGAWSASQIRRQVFGDR